MKKWLATAGLTLSLVGLAGCSSGSGDGDAASSSAPDEASATSTAGPDQAAATADLSDIPDPVATVNGEDVTKEDFAAYYESQYATASQQAQMGGGEVDTEQLQQDTLRTIVDSVLLSQAATEGGHEPSEEEVDTLLEELATSNGLSSVDEFYALLEEQGMDEATAREEAGKQLAIEAYIEEEADVEEPTEEEIRAYYDEIAAQQEGASGGEDDAAATSAPTESSLPPYEDVKEQIAQQLTTEKQSEATQVLIDDLRADAEIESHL